MKRSIMPGSDVRIADGVPGFGAALDRYAKVISVDIPHLRVKVRMSSGPRADEECWIRIEDCERCGVDA